MYPAASVIVFTTASGAGYGLLFVIALLSAADAVERQSAFPIVGLITALVLITVGLSASTLHLRHPERAWRAVSQWRSSWLSREGVAAIVTYAPALLLTWRVWTGEDSTWLPALGAAVGAAVTVGCTGMIYASLIPVRHWHNPWVVPGYLAMALMTGVLWAGVIAFATGADFGLPTGSMTTVIVTAALVKLFYWRSVDKGSAATTTGTALGLDARHRAQSLTLPHTEENYVMREMAFVVARKHGRKLRRIAVLCGFVIPVLLTLPGVPDLLLPLAALSAQLGVIVERWLFFAQAKHTVALYYGATRA